MEPLNATTQEALKKIYKEFNLKFVILFGSQASGATHKIYESLNEAVVEYVEYARYIKEFLNQK